jgi:hypothetical protein
VSIFVWRQHLKLRDQNSLATCLQTAEQLFAQLSEEEIMDEVGFQGFDVEEARHELAVQRWFLNQARQLLEGNARDIQQGHLPA